MLISILIVIPDWSIFLIEFKYTFKKYSTTCHLTMAKCEH